MSIRSLEAAILAEAKRLDGLSRLRQKDIMEWSTSEEKVRRDAQPGEQVFHCPRNGVWIAVKLPEKGAK